MEIKFGAGRNFSSKLLGENSHNVKSSFKSIQMNLFTKQKQTQTWRSYIYQERRVGGGGVVRERGIHMYTPLCIK